MAVLAALLAGGMPPGPAAAQGAAPPVPPNHPPSPFAPTAPPPSPPETWIFSGLLDDGRETYSGTLLTGSGATAFEFKLGAGVNCTGGDAKVGLNSVRLFDVPCSDDRTLQASFIARGEAELTVFGQVGTRRFATSAHRLGEGGRDTRPDDPGARETAPPPPAAPPGPTTSRPRNG